MSRTTNVPSGGTVNPDSSVYYSSSGFWNDLPRVRDHLNQLATDDPQMSWHTHLERWHGKPFRKALMLNCGNGHVERELLGLGVIEEAVGIDYSEDLLAQAREAAAGEPSLRYYQMDTNLARWPEDSYDLVVNHAACHHISHPDRVFRSLADLLPEDGVLVSWDYIGPHRNQYGIEQWIAAWHVNQALPAELRQVMRYPHIPTMLAGDPTEAVHSELFLPTLRRYFTDRHTRMLGGGIAYLLLTFNEALFERDSDDPAVEQMVDQVLEVDRQYTEDGPEERSLFAYIISQPDKSAFVNSDRLTRWTQEEEDREAQSRFDGGVYYPRTLLADLVHRVERSLAEPPPPPTVGSSLRSLVAALPGVRPTYRWLRDAALGR